MYQARMVFHAKYGKVGELLDVTKRFNEILSQQGFPSGRILTDASGRFDTVVVETEIESIDDLILMSRTPPDHPELPSLMERLVEATDHGSREYYNIES